MDLFPWPFLLRGKYVCSWSSSWDSPSGFVGAARRSGGAGGAKRRGGRDLLGTFAKSASTSLNGGDKKGFCKRARVIRTNKKERLPSDEKLGRLRKFALQGVARVILKDLKMPDGKLMFRVASLPSCDCPC